MAVITRFNKLEVRGQIYRHKYVKISMKMEFGVDTKFVLGLPRANQLSSETCKKNLRDCDHHHQPPHSGPRPPD